MCSVKQRADLTYKHNVTRGRHGWLRLTPAYSVRLVSQLLDGVQGECRILDPFSGTGTTLLTAMEHGHDTTGIDLNPFLIWFARAKICRYSGRDVGRCRVAEPAVVDAVESEAVRPVGPPALSNIERWWHPDVISFLCLLRSAIDANARASSKARDLLDVAFWRTLIQLSNAAFNHQSMSFQGDRAARHDRETCLAAFRENVHVVLSSLDPQPLGKGHVALGDARRIEDTIEGRFNLVITSPPYANRMSYIRELRPYMYWLGYLGDASEAGELDWRAVGGTWGVATSRLTEWTPSGETYAPEALAAVVAAIARSGARNAGLMATYVAKYFHDMWHHFVSVRRVMADGGKVVYIIGNSTFYGILVPVERFYARMLGEAGFANVETYVLRKRNSKKRLYEFAVEADVDWGCGFPSLSARSASARQTYLF
ncbi:MAG: site-specific DNA-methyltransferase [Candidatus Brocadiae bacterium]|nr:site-specific DNA-methyltransferase [Candidatus Brocadiia bacterium]